MPQYQIHDPDTGRTFNLTGDGPPTQAEIEAIIRELGQPAPAEGGDVVLDNLYAMGRTLRGAAKGAGRTAVGAGRLVHMVPGVSSSVDALYKFLGLPGVDSQAMFSQSGAAESGLGLDPNGAAEKIGQFLEQVGEFAIPAGAAERTAAGLASKVAPMVRNAPSLVRGAVELAPHVAMQAASSGGVTALQGGDVETGALTGGAGPIIGKAVTATGRAIGNRAVPLVRAAIKPTVTETSRTAGASAAGINAKANGLARFIIDNRLTSPDKAEAVITGAEQELQSVLKGTKAATDAPQRAQRYLQALVRSASRQGLPADDVAIIQSKAAELLKVSPLSEDVVTTVMRPSPTGIVTASGQPVMVPTQQTSRALRTDVSPDEALAIARGSGKWSTRKSWGEQKGAAVEADKAVERATRDAVKTAVPEARPILQRQGQAIQSKKVLDRMAFREGNRDALSLPAHVIAAGELASGRVPVLAFAANWLRNNQMKAGIWADQLSAAISRRDVKQVSEIMARLGVGTTVQATKPAYAGGSR